MRRDDCVDKSTSLREIVTRDVHGDGEHRDSMDPWDSHGNGNTTEWE